MQSHVLRRARTARAVERTPPAEPTPAWGRGDYIVLAFLGIAALACIVIAWFAILFTGRYPHTLFDFVLGVGRWSVRLSAGRLPSSSEGAVSRGSSRPAETVGLVDDQQPGWGRKLARWRPRQPSPASGLQPRRPPENPHGGRRAIRKVRRADANGIAEVAPQ